MSIHTTSNLYSYYFQSLYYFHIAYSNQSIVQSTNLQSIHHFLLSPIILLPISTIKHHCLILFISTTLSQTQLSNHIIFQSPTFNTKVHILSISIPLTILSTSFIPISRPLINHQSPSLFFPILIINNHIPITFISISYL